MSSMTSGRASRRTVLGGLAAGGLASFSFRSRSARAAPVPLHVATQIGLAYLPLHVMLHDRLWESHAASRGVAASFTYSRLGGGSALNDALISDAAQVVAAGVAPLLVMWDRTKTNYRVTGLSALNASPMDLLGNRPGLHTIHDLTPKDRVAVPSLRVSIQAVIFEMGIVKAFGADQLDRYVPTEVVMDHPDALAALISGGTPVTAYMSSSPFQEIGLQHKNIVKLTNSFAIQGGPATFSVAYVKQRFFESNPKLAEAYYPALDEAIDRIHRDPSGALDTYVAMTGDRTSRTLLEGILRGKHGQFSFSPVPSRTKPVADFMARTGTLHSAPASWKAYFAPALHGMAGS